MHCSFRNRTLMYLPNICPEALQSKIYVIHHQHCISSLTYPSHLRIIFPITNNTSRNVSDLWPQISPLILTASKFIQIEKFLTSRHFQHIAFLRRQHVNFLKHEFLIFNDPNDVGRRPRIRCYVYRGEFHSWNAGTCFNKREPTLNRIISGRSCTCHEIIT